MAQHIVTKEIEILVNLEKMTKEELIKKYDLSEINGEMIAWNRRTESSIKSRIANIHEENRKAEIQKERDNGYKWVKHNALDWVVAGNFEGKEVGDKITVTRASGARQEKEIKFFTQDGYAVVK